MIHLGMQIKYKIIDNDILKWSGKYYKEGIGEISEIEVKKILHERRFMHWHKRHKKVEV